MSWRTFLKTAPLLVILLVLGVIINKLSFFQSRAEENSQMERALEPLCVFNGEIKKNESLHFCLLKEGVPPRTVHQTTKTLGKVLNLRKSLPGDEFTLHLNRLDSLEFFEYKRANEGRYVLENAGDSLLVRVEPVEFSRLVKGFRGAIHNSLWESMNSQCKDPELILKFADVFAWEIDFLTEIRNGDGFRLIFEELWREGEFAKYGDILAAEYILSGDTHTAVLYQDSGGHKDYYDLLGASLRKTLLRSPLHYRRISSGFSYSRFHPVFKRYQPHYGVDYAAPVGTPVSAAGDGVVIFAGWKGGLGKTIQIRHPKGFVTSYGHLSKYAKGINKGKKVKQKDVIGYVGRTGATTGPHLDYKCQKNGRYVNPLKITVPSVEPLKKEYLADFKLYSQELLYCMNFLCPEKVLASAK
ncbi:MAG: M23 family metallopeptidase [Candidatus Zixiibacteriota bacterium]